jgi:hypothetical protein
MEVMIFSSVVGPLPNVDEDPVLLHSFFYEREMGLLYQG